MRAVALLRGVNVGGVRIAMKELAAALAAASFFHVRTVLASGNVVLTADEGSPTQVAERVAAVIQQQFGYRIAVIVVPVETVRAAVDGYPFEQSESRHAYVAFADNRDALVELAASAGELDRDVERVELGDSVLYWDAPKGETLTTTFGKQYGKRQKSGAVTTRNIRTLQKILAVA